MQSACLARTAVCICVAPANTSQYAIWSTPMWRTLHTLLDCSYAIEYILCQLEKLTFVPSSPAGDDAPSEAGRAVLISPGQADDVHVRLVLRGRGEMQQGDVVRQWSVVKARVQHHGADVLLLIRQRLRHGADVELAQSHLQLLFTGGTDAILIW